MPVQKHLLGLRRALAAFALLPAAAAQTAGLPPEWETRKLLADFSAQVERLKPLLDKVNPESWLAAGAPEAYVAQWKATRKEADYLIRSAEILSEQPEKLTAALDVLFRTQIFESMLLSLADGVRRYQNPAVAQLLAGVNSENAENREKLRQYVIDLAAVKEQELAAMDKEAQRCRQMLMRPSSAPRPAPRPVPKEARK